jgi:hypothetical protein
LVCPGALLPTGLRGRDTNPMPRGKVRQRDGLAHLRMQPALQRSKRRRRSRGQRAWRGGVSIVVQMSRGRCFVVRTRLLLPDGFHLLSHGALRWFDPLLPACLLRSHARVGGLLHRALGTQPRHESKFTIGMPKRFVLHRWHTHVLPRRYLRCHHRFVDPRLFGSLHARPLVQRGGMGPSRKVSLGVVVVGVVWFVVFVARTGFFFFLPKFIG